jgi:SRSO17 transposase
VTTTDLEAAAASTVEEAVLACGMLDELMDGLAGCFARVEPRREARKYITGLVSDLPRKNCWMLAEHAGDQSPDKMQRLLERAAWDAFVAMRAVRAFAVSHLGDLAGAVLVIDESGQEKAGEHTAGVKRQYLGCAGRVANGINVVYASYAAPAGHAVIAARLYLPQEWADDAARRRAAGVPGDLDFKTKPQLAIQMVEEVIAEGFCPPWLTGDEEYGRDAKLRGFAEAAGLGCVLKIPCSFRITVPAGQKMRADHAAVLLLPPASEPGLLVHHPGPRSRPPLAGRGGFRVRQEPFRAGRQPGPPLHPDLPAPGPGHGRARGLRRHRGLSPAPHQHPGPPACLTR